MDQDEEYSRILRKKMSTLTVEDVMPDPDGRQRWTELPARIAPEKVRQILSAFEKDQSWKAESVRRAATS